MMVMSGCLPTYYPDLSTATFVVTCILSRSRNNGDGEISDDEVFPHFHSLWLSPPNKTSKQDSSSGYRVCWATKWQLCQPLPFWPRSFSCSAPTSSTSSSPSLGSKSREEMQSLSGFLLEKTFIYESPTFSDKITMKMKIYILQL